jgi:hypothetical protein
LELVNACEFAFEEAECEVFAIEESASLEGGDKRKDVDNTRLK